MKTRIERHTIGTSGDYAPHVLSSKCNSVLKIRFTIGTLESTREGEDTLSQPLNRKHSNADATRKYSLSTRTVGVKNQCVGSF